MNELFSLVIFVVTSSSALQQRCAVIRRPRCCSAAATYDFSRNNVSCKIIDRFIPVLLESSMYMSVYVLKVPRLPFLDTQIDITERPVVAKNTFGSIVYRLKIESASSLANVRLSKAAADAAAEGMHYTGSILVQHIYNALAFAAAAQSRIRRGRGALSPQLMHALYAMSECMYRLPAGCRIYADRKRKRRERAGGGRYTPR